MFSYLLSILPAYGEVAQIGLNAIMVTVTRENMHPATGRLFGMGAKRVSGNSAAQIFTVSGVSVTLRFA